MRKLLHKHRKKKNIKIINRIYPKFLFLNFFPFVSFFNEFLNLNYPKCRVLKKEEIKIKIRVILYAEPPAKTVL